MPLTVSILGLDLPGWVWYALMAAACWAVWDLTRVVKEAVFERWVR
jgi:hypothetical protein